MQLKCCNVTYKRAHFKDSPTGTCLVIKCTVWGNVLRVHSVENVIRSIETLK